MNKGSLFIGILTLLYAACFGFKWTQAPVPTFFHSHFTDLLCMPLLLSLSLKVLRRWKNNGDLMLHFSMIGFAWLYVSLVFEWLLPSLSSRYTSDPMDVLAYSTGSVFFYFLQPLLFGQASPKVRV